MSVGASAIIAKGMRSITELMRDERGTETLEWGLVCGFLIIGAIMTLALVGPKLNGLLNDLNNTIPPSAP